MMFESVRWVLQYSMGMYIYVHICRKEYYVQMYLHTHMFTYVCTSSFIAASQCTHSNTHTRTHMHIPV